MDTKRDNRAPMVLKRFNIKAINQFFEMYGRPQPLIGYCSTSHTLKFEVPEEGRTYYGTVANIKPDRRLIEDGSTVLMDYDITFCPIWTEKGPDFTSKTVKLSEIGYGVEVEYIKFEENPDIIHSTQKTSYTFTFKGKEFTFQSTEFVKVLYAAERGPKHSAFGYLSDVSENDMVMISTLNVYRGMYSTGQIEVPADDIIGIFPFGISFSPFIFKDKKLVGPIPEKELNPQEFPEEELDEESLLEEIEEELESEE